MTKLMVIAGEASGDLHGGHVLKELKTLRPDLEVLGTGGKRIAEVGARLFYRVEDLAVIGFFEVAKRYGYFKSVFDSMVRKLDQEQPDVLFLVDYPGFNLKFSAEAKKRGIRVIYYIAPQVWAWKKKRIEKIKEWVDELIVLFPFEVDFFRKEGMEAHCFGHPLLDIVKPDCSKQEFFDQLQLDVDSGIISLLPGSRRNETGKHLPLLFETAEVLQKSDEKLQFLLPLAPTVDKDTIQSQMADYGINVKMISGSTYNAVAYSDFALVASGTATLETAILGTPEIIYYKSSPITYFIGKYLLRIKTIGLPNIIFGEMIVPEDPHCKSSEKLAEMVRDHLDNQDRYQTLKQNLMAVKTKLGAPGAYRHTAEFLHSIL